ncbi:MAG: DUF4197 domain-containing protein [Flavipsychrobacter sp.]|nr:DUF4197 domain-containing protein [Flavipsychrobacter sp.]
MKNLLKGMLMAAAVLATTNVEAQKLNDYINKANDALNGKGNGSGNGGSLGSLSNNEIVQGLKEALNVGTKNASGRLANVNGYFGNQLIKILMPPEAKKIETTLRSLGMGQQVDRAILSMNRAAEDAATKAVPIFVNAITSITIQDGLSILRGGSGAATNFLKGRTTASLTQAFRPVINNSLGKVGATKYWTEIVNIYNKLPTVRQKINPDLTGYVTERALNGLFVTIADEENKIRTNPAARVSDILKKVFGAK